MNILIVESKAKCKTLLKYLGKSEWRVLPTGGHIEDLPVDREKHPPKEVRKAYWSHRTGELPKPPWFWTDRGEAAITAIREEAGKHAAVTFYLASDPDREGERIAWHLQRLLGDLGPVHRVTFNAVTKDAVLEAVESPGKVDQSLVDAALIRTFIDRVVGWRASKIAKRYTTMSNNSMGRVQTPTLGFVVDRELEREAHVPVRYFEVLAETALTGWRARFHERDEPSAWFDDKGKFSAHRTNDRALAESVHAALVASGQVEVFEVKRGERSQTPSPPFSTDTLLQAAGGRWGWSTKKTAALAGQLYEAGHVTYIRTDSTRMAPEAVDAARKIVEGAWGKEQLDVGAAPASGAGAQDAHEAIRPTRFELAVVSDVEADVQRLYALIRARALAALMQPSRRVTLSLKARVGGAAPFLEGTVGWYSAPGWRRAFECELLDPPVETTAIDVVAGQILPLSAGNDENPSAELREDETKPPPRYTSHGLVKLMKEAGIGRPSTYSSTVERLEERGYVTLDGSALVPTESGRNVWLEAAPLFVLEDGREVFQADYTSKMETRLDAVARGQKNSGETWEQMLDDFKGAHAAAQQASKEGPLVPRTRRTLEDFIAAAPKLGDELGPLDDLTQQQGLELLADLRTRGIALLPSEKQQDYLARLLESTGRSLADAVTSAEMRLAGESPSRDECSALIDHLRTLEVQTKSPSPKQLRWIADLSKKAGLSEADAGALVGVSAFEELTGGREGTASSLIDALQQRINASKKR